MKRQPDRDDVSGFHRAAGGGSRSPHSSRRRSRIAPKVDGRDGPDACCHPVRRGRDIVKKLGRCRGADMCAGIDRRVDRAGKQDATRIARGFPDPWRLDSRDACAFASSLGQDAVREDKATAVDQPEQKQEGRVATLTRSRPGPVHLVGGRGREPSAADHSHRQLLNVRTICWKIAEAPPPVVTCSVTMWVLPQAPEPFP